MDYYECIVKLTEINTKRHKELAQTEVKTKEKEMQFNIIIYLKGRREYLKAQTTLYDSDTSSARCAQAKLSEVCELLVILEGTKTKSQFKNK